MKKEDKYNQLCLKCKRSCKQFITSILVKCPIREPKENKEKE
jgi:hypothetical protein